MLFGVNFIIVKKKKILFYCSIYFRFDPCSFLLGFLSYMLLSHIFVIIYQAVNCMKSGIRFTSLRLYYLFIH